jgi:hypothetical protein
LENIAGCHQIMAPASRRQTISSAIIATLAPGTYRPAGGKDNTTGNGVVEV